MFLNDSYLMPPIGLIKLIKTNKLKSCQFKIEGDYNDLKIEDEIFPCDSRARR